MVFKNAVPHRSLSYSVYEATRALNVRAIYNNKSEVGLIAKSLRNYVEIGYLHRLFLVVLAVAVIVYLETGPHVALLCS